MRNLSRPMAAHGKDRPPGRSFPLSVVLTATARTEGMHERQGRGIRSDGNGFHERCPDCGSLNEGNAEKTGKGKTNPAGWFSMSAPGAQGNCARCGERFETRVF